MAETHHAEAVDVLLDNGLVVASGISAEEAADRQDDWLPYGTCQTERYKLENTDAYARPDVRALVMGDLAMQHGNVRDQRRFTRQFCGTCVMRSLCRDAAIYGPETEGAHGGMTAAEVAQARRDAVDETDDDELAEVWAQYKDEAQQAQQWRERGRRVWIATVAELTADMDTSGVRLMYA